MSDCYEWIDPFAEIAWQKRRAEAAHEEGRQSVLRKFSGEAGELIRQAIRVHSDRIGEVVAREAVEDAARAISAHMRTEVGFSARMETLEEMVVTTVEMKPFRHQMVSRLPLWR